MPIIECVADFETASGVDLEEVGSYVYANHPTTEVLCLVFNDRLWTPEAQDPELRRLAEDPNVIFIAHHAGFEKDVWRGIMVKLFGYPDIPNSRWHDIMATCAQRGLPKELATVLTVMHLPPKDADGSKLTRALSKTNKKTGMYDRSPETLRRTYDYCRSDWSVETALHHTVGYLPPGERKVWLLDQRINERGVRLDLDFIRQAQLVVDRATAPLQQEFADLTCGLAPGQVAKVIEWTADRGYRMPNLQKETVAAVLGKSIDGDEIESEDEVGPGGGSLPEEVERALQIRQQLGSSSVKKLARMRQCAGADGRARRLLQYHGAGPGRWAGRLLQPQNFPRGTVKIGDKSPNPEDMVAAIMTGDPSYVEAVIGAPAIEVVAHSLRNAIIPDKGRLLVAGDFSQIEARNTLALAGQWDKVELLRATGSATYIDMAERIFGRKIDKHDDVFEYTIGKNTVLGCGFGMGGPTFQKKYAKTHPLDFCSRVVEVYREDWAPEVPKLWKGYEKAALKTVLTGRPHEAFGVTYQMDGQWLVAHLPSGRSMWYFNPQRVMAPMPWDPEDIRPTWTYQAMKNGRWATCHPFGGLLTENVAQALARDTMVAAMFRCEDNGYPVVLTVHDEILTEPVTAHADYKALEQIMEDSPDWVKALRIPIKSEGWQGERYKK